MSIKARTCVADERQKRARPGVGQIVTVVSSPDPDFARGAWFPLRNFNDSLRREIWPAGMVVAWGGRQYRVEGRWMALCEARQEHAA